MTDGGAIVKFDIGEAVRLTQEIRDDLMEAGIRLDAARRKLKHVYDTGMWGLVVDRDTGLPHTHWKSYAVKEFGVSFQRICQLLGAATVEQALGLEIGTLPERHARELSTLSTNRAKINAVYEVAKEAAEQLGKEMTSSLIKATRAVMDDVEASGLVDVGEDEQVRPSETSVQASIMAHMKEIIEQRKAEIIGAIERKMSQRVMATAAVFKYQPCSVALTSEPDELVIYVDPPLREMILNEIKRGTRQFALSIFKDIEEIKND